MRKRLLNGILASVALLLLAACGGGGGSDNDNGGGGTSFDTVVIGTDFATSNVATLDSEVPAATSTSRVLDSGDNVAVAQGDYVFVIRRMGTDAIQVSPRDDLSSILADYSVNDPGGSNANPYDLLMLSDGKAYVTRYELPTLLIVNPLNGTQLGTIDLSSLADADGIPEMHNVLGVDGLVYVSLERVDRNNFFGPTDFSSLAVIDPAGDRITGSIQLTGLNPVLCRYVPALDRIVCACTGTYFAQDGGLEAVDYHTGVSEGYLIEEADLGVAAINDFDFVDADNAYVLATTDTFGTQVHHVSLATRSSVKLVAGSDGFDFFDMALMPGRLLVADQNASNSGVRVFDTATDAEVQGSPVNTGLPPYFLLSLL